MNMKIICILIMALTVCVYANSYAEEEPAELVFMEPQELMRITAPSIDAYHSLVFTNEDGMEATIDFSGKGVTYSGDLPVADSAKLLFKAFGDMFKCQCGDIGCKAKD
jgi:hypothetical protein